MSYQPQQKQSDIVKILERENVISFKKKPKPIKDTLKSQNNNQDEDNISAQSSHSGVYSEDVNRFKGKINPLPELGKEKKRFISKNLLTQQFRINNYQEKEVRQQENLILKQKNNFLSSQNMKLKTKISTLEKENNKLQKILQQQPIKAKTPGFNNQTKERFRPSGQNLSTKILLKSLKKQLDDIKKENNNIKSSIKFTTISQLQCERDAILQQTNRMRALLQDEQNKRLMMRINQQGMSNLQQKLSSLQQRNSILSRQNQELKNRLKNNQDGNNKASKSSENQKNLTKTLYNVKRLLKQKEREVEVLKEQIKTSGTINSLAMISEKSINAPQTNLQQASTMPRKPSMERPNPSTKNFEKRIVSKSAQKNGPKIIQKPTSSTECDKCKVLRTQNDQLRNKIAQYESTFQSANPLALPTEPADRPKDEQIKALTRFIEFRFKAHHLSLVESEKYLLNTENITDEQLNKEITVEQFLEIVVTEPFVVLNKRYIEVFLMQICYFEELKKGSDKIKIDKDSKITKKALLQNYKKLIPSFELLPPSKEEEMFLQIAQLVTSYYQQILAAMSNRKNGEGTISEKDLTDFFIQIELEKEYIDFIITQIILESIDLDKLNYFAFFQIFYIPQEEGQTAQNGQVKKLAPQAAIDKKKRFQVDHVVKEEDQEYQQSRSHIGDQSRQKTLSKHADESGDSYHQFGQEQSPQKQQEHQQEHQQHQSEHEQEHQQNQEEQQEKYGQQDYEEENNAKQSPPKSQQKIEVIKPQFQLPKQKATKKKTEKDQSYVEQFQEENMHSNGQEEQKIQSAKKVKQQKGQPGKLVEKPFEIEDIQAEYEEEFQN